MVFHKSHNKWIPKPFHYVNIHLSSPTHINEKLIWAYIQIFSSKRKISVKIFVENESIHTVISSKHLFHFQIPEHGKALNVLIYIY